jgi:hypothetical protein
VARRSRVALRGRKFVPMFATCMCGKDTPRSRRGTFAKISVLQEAEKEAVLAARSRRDRQNIMQISLVQRLTTPTLSSRGFGDGILLLYSTCLVLRSSSTRTSTKVETWRMRNSVFLLMTDDPVSSYTIVYLTSINSLDTISGLTDSEKKIPFFLIGFEWLVGAYRL